MTDFRGNESDLPETEEEIMSEGDRRFDLPYDDVFNPDGSLLEPLSVLDDPTA